MTMGVVPVAKRKRMLPGKALVRMDQNPVTSVIGLLSMTTAFTIFATQVVNEGRIPFEIKADPFWCEQNQARLRESIAQLNAGKTKERHLIEN